MKYEHLKKVNDYIYEEIFNWNVYQVNPTELRGANVLDVGGHYGFFSCLADSLGAKRIIGVEANPYNYLKYVQFTKDISNCKCVNAALASKSGELVTIDNNNEQSTVGKGSINVATITLEEVVGMFPEKEDIFLKMDIEGAEYDVLLSAPGHILKRFDTIALEMHDASKFEYLDSYLRYEGFNQVWRGNFFQNFGSEQQKQVDEIAIFKYKRAFKLYY